MNAQSGSIFHICRVFGVNMKLYDKNKLLKRKHGAHVFEFRGFHLITDAVKCHKVDNCIAEYCEYNILYIGTISNGM